MCLNRRQFKVFFLKTALFLTKEATMSLHSCEAQNDLDNPLYDI
jgi:uncharacterized protein (UPF0332 family)